MKNTISTNRCKTCVLPDSYPGISFNESGACHLCSAYQKPPVKGEAALRQILSSRKGGTYDCLVTLSGGRDSSYVLYYATRVLGLKTLAMNYDNGFRHPQAVKNMQVASERAGVELLQFKSRDNLNIRIVAAALRASTRFGPGAASQFICRHCYTGGLGFLYTTAEKYKIPFILWGDSLVERVTFIPVRNKLLYKSPLRYSMPPQAWHFFRFLKLLRELRNEALPAGNSQLDVRFPKLHTPDITEVHLFDFIEWDRNTIKKAITEELGWEKPPDSISSWRFDCHLHELLNYCHKKALGFNHDIDGLANMVRAGKMTREEAMALIDRGFDSDAWTEALDHLTRKTLALPDACVATMKSW